MIITDKMVEAALNAWYGMDTDKRWKGDSTLTRDMSAALIAALAVSGYGEVVEALRRIDHTLSVHGHIDADTELHEFVGAALARVTPDPQS